MESTSDFAVSPMICFSFFIFFITFVAHSSSSVILCPHYLLSGFFQRFNYSLSDAIAAYVSETGSFTDLVLDPSLRCIQQFFGTDYPCILGYCPSESLDWNNIRVWPDLLSFRVHNHVTRRTLYTRCKLSTILHETHTIGNDDDEQWRTV